MSSDEAEPKKRLSSSPSEDEPQTKRRAGGGGGEDASSSESADTNWNVDECRGDHESVEHWELRKEFLVQNMGRYPKSRLICLSQCFANMEFLGCRYPEQTMEQVHDLSLGIVEGYREKQKKRLQRTFVKASDAAERKTKGSNAKSTVIADEKETKSRLPESVQLFSQDVLVDNFDSSAVKRNAEHFADIEKIVLLVCAYNVGENAAQIIHRSCASANVPIEYEYFGALDNYGCKCKIGKNMVVSSESGHHSKDLAKSQAMKFALVELQKHCYTFVTKVQYLQSDSNSKEIGKDDISNSESTASKAISSDNIGNKLLKMMGWTGGGLGKNEQGIQEAISVDGVVGRSRLGLGSATGVSFNTKIRELLQAHQQKGFPCDLKFVSEFSKEERKEIHGISLRLGLKSKSFGKGDDRFLVVSGKTTRNDVIKNTLAKGGETDQYRVIIPGGKLGEVEYLLNK